MGDSVKKIKNPFAIAAIVQFTKKLVERAMEYEQERIKKILMGEFNEPTAQEYLVICFKLFDTGN